MASIVNHNWNNEFNQDLQQKSKINLKKLSERIKHQIEDKNNIKKMQVQKL